MATIAVLIAVGSGGRTQPGYRTVSGKPRDQGRDNPGVVIVPRSENRVTSIGRRWHYDVDRDVE
jgi:hypothetical protein